MISVGGHHKTISSTFTDGIVVARKSQWQNLLTKNHPFVVQIGDEERALEMVRAGHVAASLT